MKDAFCPKEQKITKHKASLDLNGDFVFTCQSKDCGSFFKISSTIKDLDKALKAEEEGSKGQVSIEAQEAKLAAMLGKAGATEGEIVEEETPEE